MTSEPPYRWEDMCDTEEPWGTDAQRREPTVLEQVTRTSPGVCLLRGLRHVSIFPCSAGCADLHATVYDRTTALSPTVGHVFTPRPLLHPCATASFRIDRRHV